jgi:hypothetical protein
MTTFDELNESDRQFLKRLFEETGGESSRQLSMYEIGGRLGWEREAASRAAQDLMAEGLVEIRTLSGGVGLSAAGAEAMRAVLGAERPSSAQPRLGAGRVLDPPARQAVMQVCDGIKAAAGSLGLDFDSLAELVADLKTVAEQLGSPKPKTAVVRESLRSIEGVLKRFPGNRHLAEVRALVEE